MGKIILIKGADFSEVSVDKVNLVLNKISIAVFSDSPEWGTVTGGGIYNEGDVVTISAIPNPDCEFVEWDDGVTDATREIIVGENSKTTYIAIFKSWLLGTKSLIPFNNYYENITFYMSEQASANIAGKTISELFVRLGIQNSSEPYVDSTGSINIGIGYCDWSEGTTVENQVDLIIVEKVFSNVVTKFEPITIPDGKRVWFRLYRGVETCRLAAQKNIYICTQVSYSNDGKLDNINTKPLIDFK